MSAIATSDTVCSGHGGFPPRPVAETVSWFTVNGKPVVVDGERSQAIQTEIARTPDQPYRRAHGLQ